MRMAIFVVAVVLVAGVAFAGGLKHTTGNYAGCLSAADLDRFTSYSVQGDHAAAQRLLDAKRCFVLRPGVPVYLERMVGLSAVEIRPEGQAVTLYAPREAIK